MLVKVIRLRDHGWLLPRYQIAFVPRTEANLVLAETKDEVLNRTTRLARLLDPATGRELPIPPLLDAQLVAVTRDVMTFSGIERLPDKLELRSMDYAQTWLVSPCAVPAQADGID